MKTKTFIEKVEALDFVGKAEKGTSGLIGFPNKNGEALISVNEDLAYHFTTDYKAFKQLHLRDKKQLANIVWEYASTPLEEREEEKKYIYKFPFNVIYETKKDLYVFKILDDGLNLSNAAVHDLEINYRYHFTDKEVGKFTGKERALFNACEKIEVSE